MRDALSLRERSTWGEGSALLGRAPQRVTAIDRRIADAFQQWLRPADLRLELWDGSSTWNSTATPVGDVVVRDRWALFKLLIDPDLQFGELFTEGRVVIRGGLARVMEAAYRLPRADRLTLREWLALRIPRSNGFRLALRNVHHHYDLGNDFYELWLDRQLVYTCALFADTDATLEQAQADKLDLVCRKLRLQRGDTVIEAGCGWGALAMHMAREYGAHVKAFNISREQVRFARERAAAEGLSDRVEFIEDDYRRVEGRFDVFVSVGMLEHVGLRHFESLGTVIRRVLKPDTGRGLLHFIGRDRPRPLNAWTARRFSRAPMLQPWRRFFNAFSSPRGSRFITPRIFGCITHARSSTGECATSAPSRTYGNSLATRSTGRGSVPRRVRGVVQLGIPSALSDRLRASGPTPLYAAQPFPETAVAP